MQCRLFVFIERWRDTVLMFARFKNRLPSRRFLIVTLGICLTPLIVTWFRRPQPLAPAKPYHFPSEQLAALDQAVQVRFAVVPDSDFGLPRIGPRHGYFSPATENEKAVVSELRKTKQEVIFYVVGRNTILNQRNWLHYSPVQGPVYITPTNALKVAPKTEAYSQTRFLSLNGVAKDAPDDSSLVNTSRRVFEDATLRNGTNDKTGTWKVVARPVVASSPACVTCHNSRAPQKAKDKRRFTLNRRSNFDIVALGDTLGIALYCYRPARKVATKQLSDAERLARPFQQ